MEFSPDATPLTPPSLDQDSAKRSLPFGENGNEATTKKSRKDPLDEMLAAMDNEDYESSDYTDDVLREMYDQRKHVDLNDPQQVQQVQNPCLYLFCFGTNGKMYIGETTNFKQRIYAHKRDALNNKRGGCTALQAAINKHGWNTIQVSILAENLHSKKDRGDLENKFIYFLNTKAGQNGYNIRDGGATGNMAEETKQQLRESSTRYWAETVHPIFFFKYIGPGSPHVFVQEFKNLVEVRSLCGESTYLSANTSLKTSNNKEDGIFFWYKNAWTYATRTKEPRKVGKPNATPIIVRFRDSDQESIFRSQHAAAKAVGVKSSSSVILACNQAELNKLEWIRSPQNHAVWFVTFTAYSTTARQFVEAFIASTQGKEPELKARQSKSVVLHFKHKDNEIICKSNRAAAKVLGSSWFLVVSACDEAEKDIVRWRNSPNGYFVAYSAYSDIAKKSVETFLSQTM